jgi:ATP-binding cassette, subfamily C (CFTR/MRP), member 1
MVVFVVYSIEAKIKGTPPLTTAQAFTSIAILSLLTGPVGQLLATVSNVLESSGSINRLQKFLLADDFDDRRSINLAWPVQDSILLSVTDLVIMDVSESEVPHHPITFTAERGTILAVSGPVGSGKSTLLKCLIGEIIPKSGYITLATPFIGYCSQSPWLQNSTIKDAILGPNAFDEAWYKKVVSACELEHDFTQMPLNDMTVVGSKALKLSGGQKQRIVSPFKGYLEAKS